VVDVGLTAMTKQGRREDRTNVDTNEGIAPTPKYQEPTTAPSEATLAHSKISYSFLNSF
jgi:hypothetical protein